MTLKYTCKKRVAFLQPFSNQVHLILIIGDYKLTWLFKFFQFFQIFFYPIDIVVIEFFVQNGDCN